MPKLPPHSPAHTGGHGLLGPILIMCAGVILFCGLVLLNRASLQAQERLEQRRVEERREEWMGERQTGLRIERDPVTGCEYVVSPEGVAPRLGIDGLPRCPVRLSDEGQMHGEP